MKREMPFTVRPIGGKIVVELDAAAAKHGSLWLPENAKEKPYQGTVLAVGPGAMNARGERITPDVRSGDRVIISKYGGTEITVDGRAYRIADACDVLATITES